MIQIDDRDGLRRVTIDRPARAGSLTGAMLDALGDAVLGWDGPAMVLTGTGKVFSAGADLDEVRSKGLAQHPGWERLSAAIASRPGLTIAALNGTCAGGAMGMMLACDLRLAVPGAEIFYPVMKMGLLPLPSDPARLARLAGPSRAARILIAGDRVTVEEALGWGLIDRITAPDSLLDLATRLAAPALAAGPDRVAAIKAMIAGRTAV